jgi:hypothetical protein
MYRFETLRYGERLPALPIPRKTQKGAVAFACRHAAKTGLDGDVLRIFKKGGRKPVAVLTHRVHNYWTYAVTGGKRERLVFGKSTGETL